MNFPYLEIPIRKLGELYKAAATSDILIRDKVYFIESISELVAISVGAEFLHYSMDRKFAYFKFQDEEAMLKFQMKYL